MNLKHVFVSKVRWNIHKRVCPYDKASFSAQIFGGKIFVNIGPLVGLLKNTDIITKKTVVPHILKLNWFDLRFKWKIESRERPFEKSWRKDRNVYISSPRDRVNKSFTEFINFSKYHNIFSVFVKPKHFSK